MKTIHKFALKVADHQEVMMPNGAEILCVRTQKGLPVLYAVVDPHYKREPVIIWTYSTGQEIHLREQLVYLGSYQQLDDDFIGHVFKEIG